MKIVIDFLEENDKKITRGLLMQLALETNESPAVVLNKALRIYKLELEKNDKKEITLS